MRVANGSVKLCGDWECLFPFDLLTWSDGVYDLFEMPRGFRLSREETLGFYSAQSLSRLEEVRARAIWEGTGFNLEAEITTALGKSRWIRISASLEHKDGIVRRLYGTKTDITDERLLVKLDRLSPVRIAA